MDNPALMKKTMVLVETNSGTSYVVVKREMIIEQLKTLAALKRNFEALLK